MKNIVILGATGSIGLQTLSVIAHQGNRFRAYGLVAHRQSALMAELCEAHHPAFAVMTDKIAASDLRVMLQEKKIKTTVYSGMDELLPLIAESKVDGVMCAMVGAVGIAPAYHAIIHKKTVYLANKEAMVVAGELINRARRISGAQLLPIDSEHNALFQCLPEKNTEAYTQRGVKKLWLTASGGPFRGKKLSDLAEVTPALAINHPKWKMGPKISVDSATLMNKGLEVMEAHFLFDMSPDNIGVVIHPQSIVHSMVEYVDGSFLAQMSSPDMRTPIAHALAYPDRMSAPISPMNPLNPAHLSTLNFEEPDRDTFPCLDLAYQALRQGGLAPLVLNATNEVVVEAFLQGRVAFTDIPTVNHDMLAQFGHSPLPTTVEAIVAEDLRIRALAGEALSAFLR